MARETRSVWRILGIEVEKLVAGLLYAALALLLLYYLLLPWAGRRLADTMRDSTPAPVQTKH